MFYLKRLAGRGEQPLKRIPAASSRCWLLVTQNRVARNTLYSVIGFIFPFGVMLLFTPVLVHRLGEEGYGLWKVAISVLGFMDVLEFGLGTTIAKYVAQYTSSDDINGLSSTVTIGFSLNLAIALFMTLPLYVLAPTIAQLFPTTDVSSDQVQEAIRVVSLGFFPLLLQRCGLAVPLGLQRFGVITMIQTARSVLTVAAALLASLLCDSLQMVVLSTVLVLWSIGLASIVVGMQTLRGWRIRLCFSWTQLREMLSFTSFTGLAGIGRQVFNSLDQVTVGAVLGLSEVTYYAVAIGIAKKFISLCGALTQALLPAASSWYAAGDVRRLWKYFKTFTAALVVLNSGVAVVLLISSGPFLRLWMGEDFARVALGSYRALIVVYAVMSITVPANHIANGIGIPWVNAVGAIAGGVVTILLIMVLGQALGLEGAAWANAASWIRLTIPVYVSYVLLRQLRTDS
jgi:O-antigen/teichoic acid export membrane protein